MTPSCGLLVLGSHRCGTSMLAGLLALHGAFMGQTLPPGRNNPKGYWEHTGINEMNESMLARLRLSWDWPFVLPPRWQEECASFAPALEQTCAPFRQQALWAVKDPRLCRLLPLWLPAFSRAGQALRAIVIFRHPEGACRSLEKRNSMSRRRALAIWLHHFVDVLTHLRGLPWIAVEYDHLLAEPRQSMTRLAARLGCGDWPRIPSDAELHGFVDPTLRHHPAAPPASDEWLETRCHALYAALNARHLRGPDAVLARQAAELRAQLDDGGGLDIPLIRDIYAEIPQLRAYKLSVELAVNQRSPT